MSGRKANGTWDILIAHIYLHWTKTLPTKILPGSHQEINIANSLFIVDLEEERVEPSNKPLTGDILMSLTLLDTMISSMQDVAAQVNSTKKSLQKRPPKYEELEMNDSLN